MSKEIVVMEILPETLEDYAFADDQFAGADRVETSEARTLRLKSYGDAIVAPLAAEFIAAYMDVCVECERERERR